MTDVRIGSDRPTAVERAAVDRVVGASLGPAVVVESERLVRGGVGRRDERRHLLLPALHALQNSAGWISPGGINHLAEILAVPPAEAYGVASFYDLFRVDSPGPESDVIHVCCDAACQVAGSAEHLAGLRAAGAEAKASPCLGQCERPVAEFVQGRGRPDRVPAAAEPRPDGAPIIPQAGRPGLRLLRRIGRVGGPVDPTSLDAYVAAGGYSALASAFAIGPTGVVDEVLASGLMGRGGAAFPTGVKWRAVAAEPGPRHIVVNGDESEPGTFKDRILMEHDPFAVIEAATIAGFATGASKGWIYVRGEYPLAVERLSGAIEAATDAGFLGAGIARSNFDFEIEIRRGAGAYICGEETALFNSIEGFRGEPRQKPPFPTTSGLFGRPTAINNPETLLNVLDIVGWDTAGHAGSSNGESSSGESGTGGAAYAQIGTDGSNGSKLFCLSGNVARPGLYEVDFGATLGQVVDLAGGVPGGLQAILLGGAAGSFVGPDALEMPLTFEGARAAGASLGSGVIMAFDHSIDLAPVVARIADFFRHESCGQCVPCRVGTTRQHELLEASLSGPGSLDTELLDDIDRAMKDASICGLGHTAGSAVRSAIDLGLIGGDR